MTPQTLQQPWKRWESSVNNGNKLLFKNWCGIGKFQSGRKLLLEKRTVENKNVQGIRKERLRQSIAGVRKVFQSRQLILIRMEISEIYCKTRQIIYEYE